MLTQKIYSGGFIALFVALSIFVAEDRLDAAMEKLIGSRSLADSGRQLSVYLGGGKCEWTPRSLSSLMTWNFGRHFLSGFLLETNGTYYSLTVVAATLHDL